MELEWDIQQKIKNEWTEYDYKTVRNRHGWLLHIYWTKGIERRVAHVRKLKKMLDYYEETHK